MLAIRGGLAVQRLYRAMGINPMEKVTRARMDKRRRQAAAAAALPVAPFVNPFGATGPASTGGKAPLPGTAARLSAAWSYSQPIGRQERLAEERRRR